MIKKRDEDDKCLSCEDLTKKKRAVYNETAIFKRKG